MKNILTIILKIPTAVKEWLRSNPFYKEFLLVLFRWILLLTILWFFSWIGGWMFEPIEIIENVENPEIPAETKISFFSKIRYLIAPILAVIAIILAGASFVQDIYNLKFYHPAIKYVSSSMFALFTTHYPQLIIDGGSKQIPTGDINVLNEIGGPGYVMVQPGNVVFFKFLRKPSRAAINRSVFLAPFETIGPVINLDDQHGIIEEVPTITKDGIQVILRDINFRFRIMHKEDKARTMDDPYPFDPNALKRMGQNQTVNNFGLVPWHVSVQTNIKTAIVEYVNSHTIDDLTAPRENQPSIRREFRHCVLRNAKLWGIGAQLIWIDIGHIDIVDEDVDSGRIDLWAADWVGNAEAARAYGEGYAKAYKKLAQNEARARLFMNVTHALDGVDLSTASPEILRKLFLERTAVLLETMAEKKKDNK